MPRPKMWLPDYERENVSRALRRLGFSSYEGYLGSGLWRTTRRRLMRMQCEVCSSGAGLVLHHMTYANLGAEPARDVCTLCTACHVAVHAGVRRGGTLYPEKVVARRAGRPAREKRISALEVSCPTCGAMPEHHCRLPSGHVRDNEHKDRRRSVDARNKATSSLKRRRRRQKRAEALRMSPERLSRIDAVRESEFPLQALRELDDDMDDALRRD